MKLIFFLVFLYISLCDIVPYQGLRVSMTKKSFGLDAFNQLKVLIDHLQNTTFPNVSDTYGHGFFEQGLNLTDIGVQSLVIDDVAFDLANINVINNSFVIKGGHGCVAMTILYRYETQFMNMHLFGSSGHIMLKAQNMTIAFTYDPVYQKINCKIKELFWNVTVTSYENLYIFQRSVFDWIEFIFNKNILPVIHDDLDQSFIHFNDYFLNMYQRINNVYKASIKLDLVNQLSNFTQISDGSLVMAFNSNLSMPDHNLFKIMNKRLFSDVARESDLEICFNSQLVPDSFDITGKAGVYDISGTAKKIFKLDSNGTIADFARIITGLSLEYNYDLLIDTQCQIEKDYTVNDITYRHFTNPPTRLIVPFNCNFTTHGNLILETIMFIKANYNSISVQENIMLGLLDNITIHSIYSDPLIPKDGMQELFLILQPATSYFDHQSLISPGFKLDPLRRSALSFVKASNRLYETCYEYKEMT